MKQSWMRIHAIAIVIALLLGMSSLVLAEENAQTEDVTAIPVETEVYQLVKGLDIFALDKDVAPNAEMTAQAFYLAMTQVTGYNTSGAFSFANSNRVTCAEVMRAFVSLLGYDAYAQRDGGYPVGYLSQALSLKLFRNVKLNAGSAVTYSDFAQILYNAMPVNVLKQATAGERITYQTWKGETFLTKIMGLDKIEGQITANNITGIRNTDGDIKTGGVGKYNLEIKSKLFTVDAKTSYLQHMIGRYVEVYYRNGSREGDVANSVVYGTLSKKDDSITIDAADVIGYNDGVLSYVLPGQTRTQTQSLSGSNVFVIYNGQVETSYSEETFDIGEGTVTLVSGPNTDYETVIIKEYVDFPVSGIDELNSRLYNKIPNGNTPAKGESIVVDENNSTNDITIRDTKGNSMRFADIRYGDLLSVAHNGHYTEIIVSREKLREFVIDAVEQTEETLVLYSGEQSVTVSTYFLHSDDFYKLKPGDKVTILLNAFGKAAWISPAESGFEYYDGYLVQTALQPRISSFMEMKVLRSDGELVYLETAPRVVLDDANGLSATAESKKRLTAAQAYEKIANVTGVFRYRLNADGLVDLIELPLTQPDESRPNYLHQVTLPKNTGYEYRYKSSSKTFGAQYYLTDATIVYEIPEDLSDDDAYQVKSASTLENDRDYLSGSDAAGFQAKMYSVDPASIVLHSFVYTKSASTPSLSANSAVVVKIVKAIANDGTELTRLICNRNGTEVIYDCDSAGQLAIENAYDIPTYERTSHSKNVYQVQVGDVIRCATTPKTGYVNSVRILWRPTAVNPAFPNGQRGHLLGTTGKFSPTQPNSNPYIARETPDRASEYPGVTSGSHIFTNGKFRIFYGWVYSIKDGIMKVTNQDLSIQEYDPTVPGEYSEIYNVSNFGNRTLIDLETKDITARKGEMKDILSYETAGNSCSRVIMTMNEGSAIQMYIINGNRE